jgi:hypothetical protein
MDQQAREQAFMSALATGHFVLQAARSAIVGEQVGRATTNMGAVSSLSPPCTATRSRTWCCCGRCNESAATPWSGARGRAVLWAALAWRCWPRGCLPPAYGHQDRPGCRDGPTTLTASRTRGGLQRITSPSPERDQQGNPGQHGGFPQLARTEEASAFTSPPPCQPRLGHSAVLDELAFLEHRSPLAHALSGPQQRALPATAFTPAGKAGIRLLPAPQDPENLNRILALVRLGQLHGIQLAGALDPPEPIGRNWRKPTPEATVTHLVGVRSLRVGCVEVLKCQLLLHSSTHLRQLGWSSCPGPGPRERRFRGSEQLWPLWSWLRGSDSPHRVVVRRGGRTNLKVAVLQGHRWALGGVVAGGSAPRSAGPLDPCAVLTGAHPASPRRVPLGPIGMFVRGR